MSKKIIRTPLWVQYAALSIGSVCVFSAIGVFGHLQGFYKLGQGTLEVTLWVIASTGCALFVSTIPSWIGIRPTNWVWSGISIAGLAGVLFAAKLLLQGHNVGEYDMLNYLAIYSFIFAGWCMLPPPEKGQTE